MTDVAAARGAPKRRVTTLYPATKFQAPPDRLEHVSRARCLATTGGGAIAAPHLLISAPPGAGKSTLAAQWAAQQPRCAWVSLTEYDNELGQFWAALIVAISGVVRGFGSGLLPRLLAGVELRRVLIELVDELASLDEPLAVVLDDLHVVTDAQIHASLAWLLERAPAQVRIAICTRVDPRLPIDRLVVRGRLTVLRGGDLPFDVQETTEFLQGRLGLALDRDELEAITRTTDGWVAGIYLAALSLQADADPRAVIDALAGGDQRVREYVEAEVLDKLAPDRLHFLAAVAVLERFSPALCDAVLGRSDSEAVLRELERSNLFVIPLDRTGTWFRLHHFFASLLRQCESSPRGAELVRLYERAAAWHREHDDVTAAIRYLIEADHPDDAGSLMAVAYPRYINTSRLGAILRSWLAMLPAEVVERSPGLCLMAAWVAGFEGAGQELERRLEQAVSIPPNGPLPNGSASAAAEAALLRSVFCAGDVEAGRRYAHEAARLDRHSSPWWPVRRALEGIWGFLVDGPTDAVLAILEEAAPLATAAGQDIVAATAYGDAAVLMLQRGAMASAELAARRCIGVRERSGIGRVPQAAGRRPQRHGGPRRAFTSPPDVWRRRCPRVAARRDEEAGRLIAETQVTYLNCSRFGAAVRRWLDLLPAAVVAESPALCISRAWVSALAGHAEEMERWLRRAEQLPGEGPLPDGSASAAAQVALIRGINCRRDLGTALENIRSAALLDSEQSPWWPAIQCMLGLWGYFKHGPSDEVIAALRRADAGARAAGQSLSAVGAPALLAVILLERGERGVAQELAERAARTRRELGVQCLPQGAYSWWATSYVHLVCGRLPEAARDASIGVTVTADIAHGLDSAFLRVPCRIQLAEPSASPKATATAPRCCCARSTTSSPMPPTRAGWCRGWTR